MNTKDKTDTGCSFRFDHVRLKPEQQIALHQQPTWELSYVVSGAGERIIGSTREPFHGGDVVLIAPQMPHCWLFDPAKTDAQGLIENITVTFTTTLLDTTARDYPEARPMIERLRALPDAIQFVGHSARRLGSLLSAMTDEPASVQLFMLLQVVMLMAQIDERMVIGRISLSPARRRLQTIETFLTCNYKRDVALAELAQHVGMNQTALCKFLKQQLGQTFTQCLTERRMNEARNLLSHTDLTVSEVCYRSGFNDVPHFCRQFRQQEGMTPTDYRRKQRPAR